MAFPGRRGVVLNAKQADLAETMKKFDQQRAACKPPANETQTDPRPVGNAPALTGSNDSIR